MGTQMGGDAGPAPCREDRRGQRVSSTMAPVQLPAGQRVQGSVHGPGLERDGGQGGCGGAG